MLNIMFAIKLAIESILGKSLSIKSQKGVTMIEYALIGVLISVAAVTMLSNVGTSVNAVFNNINSHL